MMKVMDHYWFTVPCSRTRIEEILRRAEGSLKILDAGCNEGYISAALIEAGHHVTSIDNDKEALKKAKEFFGIEGIEADVCDLPFLDNWFDLVIAGELLEHLDNPGKGLSELFRVSRDRVLLSLPIGSYWLGCQDHKWQIDSCVIEHDQGLKKNLEKKIIILEFSKRK